MGVRVPRGIARPLSLVRRIAFLALAGAALVGALALLGNLERERRADRESDGMSRVLDAVGKLDSPNLHGFRLFVHFDCLVYKRGRNGFALEVCVDDSGRVVEAIDRRNGDPSIWSLRDDPTKSSVRVDPAEVNRLLRRMNVPSNWLLSGGGG